MFLAKYDDSGNELWVKGFGSNNPSSYPEGAGRPVIDNINNCIYLVGTFYNSLTIAGHIVNGSGIDIFLAKFNFSGTCQWIKRAGSNSYDDRASAAGIDANGNIYWTGILVNDGTVDTVPVNKGTFLAKLDPNGNLLWARKEMTYADPGCIKVINNEIFFAGTTRSDTTIIDSIILYNHFDAFVAKTDTNGNGIWAKAIGGPSQDYGTTFELGSNNDIYLVGQFEDSLFIDGDTLTNNGKADMFFTRLDSSGNLIWIRQSKANGPAGALGYDIAKDSFGKLYVTGYFGGNATFGTFNVTAPGFEDAFIARYDDTGSCLGIRHFGEAKGNSVQVDNNGDIIIAGGFLNTINIGSTTLPSYGGIDIFFAKSNAITGMEVHGRLANNQLIIYANPTAGKCNITIPDDFIHEKNLTLNIYDNTGKLIQQKTLEMNNDKIKLNLEAEAKGVYNVTLSNGVKSYSGKIVFQ